MWLPWHAGGRHGIQAACACGHHVMHVTCRLYTCEADLEKAISSLDTCRHDLKDREAKLHHLMTQLQTHYAEKEHLQEVIGHNQHSKDRLCQEFDFRMCSLRVRKEIVLVLGVN